MNKKPIERVDPIQGAAVYKPGTDTDGKSGVYMTTPDGHTSCIQVCRNAEHAQRAAANWQKKENKLIKKYGPGD
jgi:hypothetical protein